MSNLMTRAQLSQMARKASPDILSSWYPFMVKAFTASDIVNDPRQAGIMASVLNETGGMTIFDEYTYQNTPYSRVAHIFGHSAPPLSLFNEWKRLSRLEFDINFFNWVYDDAHRNPGYRLGNIYPGDGYKFRGMGPGQLTGRGNYTWMSKELGLPMLIETPEMIKLPEFGAILLTHFWRKHNLNAAVDDGSLEGFMYAMRRINAGLSDFSHHVSLWHMTTAVMANDNIPDFHAPGRADLMEQRDAVKDMQEKLWGKGYDPKGVDGFVGPGTSAAISSFEAAIGLKKDGLVDDEMLAALKKPYLGLQIGATDRDSVKVVQEKLIGMGQNIGATGADGAFGRLTRAALERIQTAAGKRPSGFVDSDTVELLKLAA